MATGIRLPKIKFCGLTKQADVRAAIECGADAIGLNFYKSSSRYVSPEAASGLSEIADQRVLRVGVFVNASPAEVDAVLAECQLDCIQLHGDETPAWIAQSQSIPSLQSIFFIKAVTWRDNVEDRETALAWSRFQNPRLLGLLVDAFDPNQRGGTGKTARWDLLFPRPEQLRNAPLLLAGGLTPENISRAIETARPDGVDIASGIESAPGVKDHAKMQLIAEISKRLLQNP